MKETYATPHFETGFPAKRRVQMGKQRRMMAETSQTQWSRGWRDGLELRPSLAMGRTGGLETRERGISDGDDSGDSLARGESFDSKVEESELGLHTWKIPQTAPLLLDYDANVSNGNERIWSQSEESHGVGPVGSVVPKSRARAAQASPKRAISRIWRSGGVGGIQSARLQKEE